MPRQKEYDRQSVIESAGTVFYQKGFEATSMTDLVAATGLNTASMYKEFKSKEGLFEASLDNYLAHHIQHLIAEMVNAPSLESLVAYLEKLQEYAQSDSFNGCLLMNNLAEFNIASDGTIDRIEALYQHLETLFKNCLATAQANGQIPLEKDTSQLADFILCMVNGITFYARVESRRSKLPGILQQALDALKS